MLRINRSLVRSVILSGSIIENSIQESVDHVYCHVGRFCYKIRNDIKLGFKRNEKLLS